MIEWTEKSWNPVVGCSKVSDGCRNCYAIGTAHRMAGHPNPKVRDPYKDLTYRNDWLNIEWTGLVRFLSERLNIPLKTRKPTIWFVNSMSDLFHELVSDDQLDQVFAVMAMTPQHRYQILAKRPERMKSYINGLDLRRIIKAAASIDLMPNGNLKIPFENIWLGVSVENNKAAQERIPLLLRTPAALRFISCEPLLEQVNLRAINADGIQIDSLLGQWAGGARGDVNGGRCEKLNWVIIGGESGSEARPCNIDWIRSIVQECKNTQVPVFVKQLGSKPKGLFFIKLSGKGNNPDEWPLDMKIRQMPHAPVTLNSH